MLFNSFHFVVFFTVVAAAYLSVPNRARWFILLCASYYFYACWNPKYLLLIVGSTLVTYVTGILIERAPTVFTRKAFVALSLGCNLGLLCCFKYLPFLGRVLQDIVDLWNPAVVLPRYEFLLPVGISFYVFQALGYTVDVYRRNTPAEKHLGIFALYVSFFPQLVAGPIERSNRLLPQFRERRPFTYDNFKMGMQLAMWGLFKKIVVADSAAVVVDTVYGLPDEYSGPVLLIATFLFSIQIYCDFSGYSDIAIGVARILGYDLMTNFRQPYFAKSVAEFWRRWHISLSTWFRDYMYVPLGGNRVGKLRWAANIMIVFTVSGLWHGANWTFVIWGALHGVYLVAGNVIRAVRQRYMGKGEAGFPRLWNACGTIVVFVLVCLAWVPFRAQSVRDAAAIYLRMPALSGFRIADLWTLGLPRFEMMTTLAMVGLLLLVEFTQMASPEWGRTLWRRSGFRHAACSVCFYLIVFFGVFGGVEFIYFQF